MVFEAIDLSKVQDSDGKLWPARPHRSKRRLKKIVEYFIDTPMRLRTGVRLMKHGGIPQGSCFTNIIDSIVNAIVCRYLVYSLTDSLPLDNVYMCDDSLLCLTELVDLEDYPELAQEQFGMKSITRRLAHLHFLGSYCITFCVELGDYPVKTIRGY